MKCKCGEEGCDRELYIKDIKFILEIPEKKKGEGMEIRTFYFDANDCVEMIKELKQCLLKMAGLPVDEED